MTKRGAAKKDQVQRCTVQELEAIRAGDDVGVPIDESRAVSTKEFPGADAGDWGAVPGGFNYTYKKCTRKKNDGNVETYALRYLLCFNCGQEVQIRPRNCRWHLWGACSPVLLAIASRT